MSLRSLTARWFSHRGWQLLWKWAPATVAAAAVLAGICLGAPALVGAGIAAAAFALGRRVRQSRKLQALPLSLPSIAPTADVPPSRRGDEDPTDLGMLVEEMLSHGRYALLMRPQIVGNLTSRQLERTTSALADGMALCPAGEVVLGDTEESLDQGRFSDDESTRTRLTRVSVEDFLLDRCLVTNRQFHQFVASCGYEQMSLWDPAILAAVLDFVDQTGMPGPHFWRDGRYPRGEEDYPVVGVSWFEAAAFARWVGKRLPTDAEWVKAASWPVPVAAGVWQQRKFPWGNAMERNRANLWGAGPGRTVPVDEFREGASVGGVHQLVGNVWEWTTGDFGYDDLEGPLLADPLGSATMRTLRGGAFDTYFESQASCQFRSGDHPLARKHNIGFRCALSACDVLGPAADVARDELPGEAPDETVVESQLEEVGV